MWGSSFAFSELAKKAREQADQIQLTVRKIVWQGYNEVLQCFFAQYGSSFFALLVCLKKILNVALYRISH